jgi:hypothetical protein
MTLQAVDEWLVAGSPEGTAQRSPQRKLWETVSATTRKPRQGRHIRVAVRRMNLCARDFVESFSGEGT